MKGKYHSTQTLLGGLRGADARGVVTASHTAVHQGDGWSKSGKTATYWSEYRCRPALGWSNEQDWLFLEIMPQQRCLRTNWSWRHWAVKRRNTVRDANGFFVREFWRDWLHWSDSFGLLTSLTRSERKKGSYFKLESGSNSRVIPR